MAPTTLNRVVLLTTALVLAVGVFDSVISREWDLLAVFAAALALQVILLARLSGRRPAVPLRSDLVAWLRNRAALNGEPMETVADRAVSAYRAGFSDLDESTGSSSDGRRQERRAPAGHQGPEP